MPEVKQAKPQSQPAQEQDRADLVRIGDPGIVCFGPGDNRGKPLPAMVLGKGGRRTLELMVANHGAWKYVNGARHWADPELVNNEEIRNNVYSWAFNDE